MRLEFDNRKLFEFTLARYKETLGFGQPFDNKFNATKQAKTVASDIEKKVKKLRIKEVGLKTIEHAIFDEIARMDKETDMIMYGFAEPQENGQYIPTMGICYNEEDEKTRLLREYIIGELRKK